jgi:anti-anti-sigma regulatory factor
MKVMQQKELTQIILDGELTINSVAGLKDGLLEAIWGGDRFEIDLQGVTAIDLAGLQILCSMHRAALEQGKALSLRNMEVPALQQARCAAGFMLIHNCRFDTPSNCLWVGGIQE